MRLKLDVGVSFLRHTAHGEHLAKASEVVAQDFAVVELYRDPFQHQVGVGADVFQLGGQSPQSLLVWAACNTQPQSFL